MNFLEDFSNWVGLSTIVQTMVVIGVTIAGIRVYRKGRKFNRHFLQVVKEIYHAGHKLRAVTPEEGQENKEKYKKGIEELERATAELLLISGQIKVIEPKD